VTEVDLLQELVNQAEQLNTRIGELTEGAGTQFVSLAHRARTNRRMIAALAASVALDVLLSVVLIITLAGVKTNDNRISALTTRLDVSQTVTRQNAFCPLYTVLKGTESAAGRAAAPDKAAYDHAYAVVQQGYDALGCSSFTSAPVTLAPTP
jgi:hypothetical protein